MDQSDDRPLAPALPCRETHGTPKRSLPDPPNRHKAGGLARLVHRLCEETWVPQSLEKLPNAPPQAIG